MDCELYGSKCKQLKWISVEDRLPDEGDIILAWNRTVQECRVRILGEDEDWYSEYRHSTMNLKSEKENITHWMSLPEPPDA